MDASVSADVPFAYDVIGEHVSDPQRLLAIDAEGQLFDLDLVHCQPVPTELTDDWVIDLVAFRRTNRDDTVLPPPVLVVG